MASVLLTVVVPIAVLLLIVALVWRWYQRKVAAMAPDASPLEIRGTRLTAERLRTLTTPPWRVVYEIGTDALGSIDHVVVGPGGAVAIETVIGDRPDPVSASNVPATAPAESTGDAARPSDHTIALAAIARGDVDELLGGITSCSTVARVHWGTPDPTRSPTTEVAPGFVLVEGQRLVEWLVSLPPGPLTAAQVDVAWQRVVTGIGRPDPLS